MKHRTVAIACLLILAAGIAVSQQDWLQENSKTFFPMEPRYEKMTVGRVGKLSITAQEFLLSYEFGPAFPKREKDSKERYLNFMIYEKLLALDGEAQGFDKTPEAKRLLDEISGDLVTEELYRDAVAPRVKVTKSMIARGVDRQRRHITVKWIYAPTEKEMSVSWKALNAGVSFDTLFGRQFAGGKVSTDDRMMETTRFKLEMANPILSSVVDTLRFGHVSLPIHTSDGWYIVRLTDGWSNAIVTQTDDVKDREDVERALVQHRSDSLSDKFVDSLMKSGGPVIQRRSLDIVWTYLATQLVSADSVKSWGLADRLRHRWNMGMVDRIDEYKSNVLVKMKHDSYTIDDFFQWYASRDSYVNLPLTGPEKFYGATEQLVWRMVRDRILTRLAMKKGLQNRATVRHQKEWWRQKVAYSLEKSALAESIHISDDSVRSYYASHTRDFRDDKGKTKTFEEAKDDVRTAVTNAELTKLMLHRILALKAKYGVDINVAVLMNLQVDTENQPKAIDVYPVKKGGIFPHRAFPSIDYEWQSWD